MSGVGWHHGNPREGVLLNIPMPQMPGQEREDPHAVSSCYFVYAGTLGGSVQPRPVAVEGIL